MLSLSKLSPRLLPYLPLYRDCVFDLPITRRGSGERLGHADVALGLERETADYWVSLGSFGETIRVGVEVECSGYDAGVAWLRDVLFGAEFDTTR